MADNRIVQPLIIAGRELPSRVVFGPISTNLADGRAFSPRHTAFYRERAAGGCGLIVTEDASVHDGDWPYERCPSVTEAGPGWSAIADACHEEGSLVVAGLSHAGGQSTSAFSQRELWAPSDEPDVNTREVPKIMEQADIDEVVRGFGRGAALATASGMDGVEINAGQHSLVRQFLSGLTNRRQDAYGEDRLLLARQVLESVRREIGPGIVGLRLSCDELAPWAGITPESATEIAVELAPLIDYLVVVRGSIFSVAETRPTAHHPEGFNLDMAGQIRQAIAEAGNDGLAVVAQGSIVSIEQASQAIDGGRCDAVEMTRAQLADPQLVANTRAELASRPCVLCNQLCNVRDNRNPIISCIANPRAGHETSDHPEPTGPATPDRADRPDVLVIGGGPAGLEAARVAARRGFAVRLHESAGQVGGVAAIAGVAPANRRLLSLVSWLEQDAQRHGVDIRCNSTVDAEQLQQFGGPVIVATGGSPGSPAYVVEAGFSVIDAAAVLAAVATGRDEVEGTTEVGDGPDIDSLLTGEEIAIWDPIGGPIAVAVAEIVASMRPKVSFITPDAIAGTMLSLTGDLAGANVRLQQAGVTIVRRQRLVGAGPDGLKLVNTFTGETQRLDADVLIDASSRVPRDDLRIDAENGSARVGDAVAPRTVAEAIREGRAAAMAIPLTGRSNGERR